METTTKIAAAQGPAFTVSLHSAAEFDVDVAMLRVEGMRKMASDQHQRFEVAGRDAAYALMADVYSTWHAANAADVSTFRQFIADMKLKLKDLGVELRANTADEAVLIRYIFADASPKQVHVYGRALRVALERNIAANGFESMVRSTEDGFEGLRKQAAGTSSKDVAAVTAFSSCSNQPTLDEVAIAWEADEQYKVLIAVRSSDGLGELKDALLDADKRKAVLLQFESARKARIAAEKPKELSKAEKALIGQLTAQIAEQDNKATQISLELRMAEQTGNPAKLQELNVHAQVASAMRAALQSSLDSLKPKAAAVNA